MTNTRVGSFASIKEYEKSLNKANPDTMVWDPKQKGFISKASIKLAETAPLPSGLIKPLDDKESFQVNQHIKNEPVIQNAKKMGITVDPYNQKEIDYWGDRLHAHEETKPKTFDDWKDFYDYLNKNGITGDMKANLMNPKTADFNIYAAWKDDAPLKGITGLETSLVYNADGTSKVIVGNPDKLKLEGKDAYATNFKESVPAWQSAVDKYQFTSTTQPWKYIPPQVFVSNPINNSDKQKLAQMIAPQQELSYETKLTPGNEKRFQQWYQTLAPLIKSGPTPDINEQHYDFRGIWKELGNEPFSITSPNVRQNAMQFFIQGQTDKANIFNRFATPGNPNFSVESVYATGDNFKKAGYWNGETFIPPKSIIEPTGIPEPSPIITGYKPFAGDTRDLFGSENLKQFHAAIATTTGWNKKVLEETAQKIKGFENVRETTFEELVGELKLHVQENDALPGVSAADKEANRNELLNTFNTNYAAREEVIGSFVKLLDQKKGVYDWADPVFADAWGKAYTWQSTSAVDILYNKDLAAEDNPRPTNLDEIATALTYLPGSQDDPTAIKTMMTEIPGMTKVRAKKIAGHIDHIAYLEAVKSSESASDRAERKQRIKNQEATIVATKKLNPSNKTLQGFSGYYKMVVERGDHLMKEVFADPNADWTEGLIQKYEQALMYQNMDEREIEQVAWNEWNSKRR